MEYETTLDYTWGELIELINIQREKRRRDYQEQSKIAWIQAQLTASWVWKGDSKTIFDVFPYWTNEEKQEAQVEKYKQRMYKYVNNTRTEK